jgi:hypothetical protein
MCPLLGLFRTASKCSPRRRVSDLLCMSNFVHASGEPTFADAILDHIVHNAYRLELEGQSMRKTITKIDDEIPQT